MSRVWSTVEVENLYNTTEARGLVTEPGQDTCEHDWFCADDGKNPYDTFWLCDLCGKVEFRG